MHHVQLLQETESEEELVSVSTDGTYVQAHVLAEPLHHITKVHAADTYSAPQATLH